MTPMDKARFLEEIHTRLEAVFYENSVEDCVSHPADTIIEH